jgi:hypothetical protein
MPPSPTTHLHTMSTQAGTRAGSGTVPAPLLLRGARPLPVVPPGGTVSPPAPEAVYRSTTCSRRESHTASHARWSRDQGQALGSPVGAAPRPVGAAPRPVGAAPRPVGAAPRPVGAAPVWAAPRKLRATPGLDSTGGRGRARSRPTATWSPLVCSRNIWAPKVRGRYNPRGERGGGGGGEEVWGGGEGEETQTHGNTCSVRAWARILVSGPTQPGVLRTHSSRRQLRRARYTWRRSSRSGSRALKFARSGQSEPLTCHPGATRTNEKQERGFRWH